NDSNRGRIIGAKQDSRHFRACPEEESKRCPFGGSQRCSRRRGWRRLRSHEVPRVATLENRSSSRSRRCLRRAGVVMEIKVNLETANAAASCCPILVDQSVITAWPT